MAKNLGKVSEETQALFDKVCGESGLDNFMDISVVNIAKSKKLIEIQRCPPIGEWVAKKEDVVCIKIYDRAFERLTPEMQEILMRDAFNNINFDSEKEKIIIGVPQITVTCEGRAKYGEKLIDAAENGVMAIQQILEEEREEKERLKAEKAAKRKQKQ